MKNRLKIRFFQILLLICMVLSLASIAQAGSSMEHHHHGTITSPFDKVDVEKPLHCILNRHLHGQSAYCPHQNQAGKAGYTELRPDCETHSGSANFSTSISKDLSKKITSYYFTPSLFSWEIVLLADKEHENLPRSIDHPPQLT